MQPIEAGGRPETAAVYGHVDVRNPFLLIGRGSRMPLIKAGQKGGFVWPFPSAEWPRIQSLVRFTDDAGLHWEIDQDLRLQKVAKRDW